MKRSLFFVLAFPPAFMNLLLAQASPSSLARYFIAGYLITALPAVAIALTDEMLSQASAVKRASWCGLVGLIMAPAMLGAFTSLGMMAQVQVVASSGIAAFLCTAAFATLVERRATAKPARQSAASGQDATG